MPVVTPHSGTMVPRDAGVGRMLAHLLLPWQVLTGVETFEILEPHPVTLMHLFHDMSDWGSKGKGSSRQWYVSMFSPPEK